MDLLLHPAEYSICKLDPSAKMPTLNLENFCCVTSTASELSIVTESNDVPPNAQHEDGWRLIQIVGTLDFDQVGVIARLTDALASAEVPVFVISTFETDYFLVRRSYFILAEQTLTDAGYQFV